MFDGNDIVEMDGGGNLLANSIVAGVGLAIAGISYACGSMIGKNSAAKENKRLMWSIARTKQERLRVFGKDQFEYLNELFSDEEDEVVSNSSNGRVKAKK